MLCCNENEFGRCGKCDLEFNFLIMGMIKMSIGLQFFNLVQNVKFHTIYFTFINIDWLLQFFILKCDDSNFNFKIVCC